MIYYAFSEATGELTGSRTPQIDPRETELKGQTTYTLPGRFETAVAPPETAEPQIAVWDGVSWSAVSDHRGETWYSGGEPVTITALGEPDVLGFVATPPPPPPPTINDFAAAVQSHIDDAARSRGYNDSASLASYVSSTLPQWAAEASAFVAWRDAVWMYAYNELAKVQGGQRPVPTIGQMISELPTINWP